LSAGNGICVGRSYSFFMALISASPGMADATCVSAAVDTDSQKDTHRTYDGCACARD
jgi:hypothetical protein